MSSKLKAQLANYASLVVAVVTFIGGWIFTIVFNFKSGDSLTLIALISIFFSMTADRFVSHIQREDDEKNLNEQIAKLSKSIDNVYDRMGSAGHFEMVGSSDDVPKLVADRLKTAKCIKNTFVQLAHPRSKGAPSYREITASYESLLSREDTRWLDIVSINELFSGRYDEIFKDPSESGRKPNIDQHQVGVLRHNIPLINFILISDESGVMREVFFGWIVDTENMTSPVFHSRDTRLVAMFDRYFSLLWNSKLIDSAPVSVDYSKEHGARLVGCDVVDREGYWATLAYRGTWASVNAAPFAAAQASGKPAAVFEKMSVGILKIAFVNGKPTLKGIIHHANGQKEKVNTGKIAQTTNRMYFDYLNDHFSESSSGFCTYEFVKDVEGEYLSGFFVNRQTNGKIDLIGVPVRDAAVTDDILTADPGKDPLAMAALRSAEDILARRGITLS